MDRIGTLPDEVLCHILSFLTTKEAALTSTLSQKWYNLWTLVPSIDIDDSEFLNPEEGKRERDGMLQCFMDFVDRVLALHGDSPIKKFSLKCEDGIDPDRVNLWICNVLQRGVTNLDLVLDFRIFDDDIEPVYKYLLPKEMFVSSKLVELNIRSDRGVDWWRGGKETYLPMLKSLNVVTYDVYLYSKLEVFLSAFPVLEELYLSDIGGLDSKATASSATLRKLSIYTCALEINRNPKSFSFDTPNLVYLDYCDFVAADYPKLNLPNLAEALLRFRVLENQIELIREPNDEDEKFLHLRNVWKLINGIRNVQSLFFSADTLEVSCYFVFLLLRNNMFPAV